LIDVHELSKGQGKLSRSCPNNISINSHKKHGGWNEKMAETGQEEGKQNIRIKGALLICFEPQMDVHYSYVFCAIEYKIGHPLYVKNRCISYIHWTSIVVFAALVWTSIGRNKIYI
ncbi:hypothetical protein NQ317_011509, partial [Molorchus minor]